MTLTPFDRTMFQDPEYLPEFNRSYVRTLDAWTGRHYISNIIIAGPEGVGKSTLIHHYFTEEKCRSQAMEYKNLVTLCHFSESQLRDDAEVYRTLVKAAEMSLGHLADAAEDDYLILDEKLQDLYRKYPDYKTDYIAGQELLDDITSQFRGMGYAVTLVIDDFQQLTSSTHCAKDTFNMMAHLSQEGKISYIVITDRSIAEGTRNYAFSEFGRIFDEPMFMTGGSGKKTARVWKEAVRRTLASWEDPEEEQGRVSFSEDELDRLWRMCGGIPGLLQGGLKACYKRRVRNADPISNEDMQELLLSGNETRLDHWMKHMDPDCQATLAEIQRCGGNEEAVIARLARGKEKIRELKARGLIIWNEDYREWDFICPLFREYVKNMALRPLPGLTQEPASTPEPVPAGQGGIIYVQGDLILNGGVKNVQTNVAGLGLSETISMLNEAIAGTGQAAALQLGTTMKNVFDRMMQQIPQNLMPDALPGETAQEGAQREEQIDRCLHSVLADVETNENHEVVGIPAQEMKTLEQHFREARNRRHADLTDEFLSLISPGTELYLKMGVVVEDMFVLAGFMMKDFSPQIVFYGKALEQMLRDSLYDLFHNSDEFHNCGVDFESRSVDQVMIGDYCRMLHKKKHSLANLCEEQHIIFAGEPRSYAVWKEWWRNLDNDVKAAKDIRNEGAHPSSSLDQSPDGQSVRQLYDYLVGSNGKESILLRLTVGSELRQSMKVDPIPPIS